MAEGTTTFTTEGRDAVKNEFPLAPIGEYEATVKGAKATVEKAQESGLPYVKLALVLDNPDPAGKPYWLFHSFFLSLKPWKDGRIGPTMADQITGFAKAAGVEFTAEQISVTNNEGEAIPVLQPSQVRDYLQALDGARVRLRVKHENKKDQPKRARVDHFIKKGVASESASKDNWTL